MRVNRDEGPVELRLELSATVGPSHGSGWYIASQGTWASGSQRIDNLGSEAKDDMHRS
jgi:hypothetical protein